MARCGPNPLPGRSLLVLITGLALGCQEPPLQDTGSLLDPDLDGDGSPASEDCNDDDPSIYPGADELCDGINNDCDAGIDEDAVDGTAWYPDLDEDGFGDIYAAQTSCEQPPTYLDVGGDCNDEDALVYPGAPEICDDGQDNDCDPATVPCEIGETLTESLDEARLGDVQAAWGGEDGARMGEVLVPSVDMGGEGIGANAGAPGWDLGGQNSGAVFRLEASGDRTEGLSGASAGHEAGSALAAEGDLDGDGYGDLLVGSPGANTGGTDSGSVCLVLGPIDAISSLEDAALCFNGEASYDLAGETVAFGGDLDGDGVADLLVGATGQGDGTDQSRGAIYVLSSDLRGSFDLENASARIWGPARYDRLGSSMAGPVDLDGDGQADLVGGASTWDGNEEQGGLFVLLGPLSGDRVAEDSGVWVEGPSDSALGTLTDAADMNGDGYTDLILGAPGGSDSEGAGQVWLLSGPIDGPVSLDDAEASVEGKDRGAGIGSALATGDLNGDGTLDLAIGAPLFLAEGRETGQVGGFYGPLSGVLQFESAELQIKGLYHGDEFGSSVLIPGDSSGDGLDDIWVGAPGYEDGAGVVFFYTGG